MEKDAIKHWGYVPAMYRGPMDNSLSESNENMNKAVTHLLREFVGHTKMITSYGAAVAYYVRQGLTQGIKVTARDVQDAYDIAYGFGCEFEWLED